MTSSRRASISASRSAFCAAVSFPAGDGFVEPLGDRGLQRGLEPVDGLVLRLRDVRERLAGAQLLHQLRLGEPEIAAAPSKGRRMRRCGHADPVRPAHRDRPACRQAGPGPSSGTPFASRFFAASPCSFVSFPAATAASIRASAAPLIAASSCSRGTFSRLATSSRKAFCSAARSAGLASVGVWRGPDRPRTPRRSPRGRRGRLHRRRACSWRRSACPQSTVRASEKRKNADSLQPRPGPVAQRLEQRTHNPTRAGSIPARPIDMRGGDDLRQVAALRSPATLPFWLAEAAQRPIGLRTRSAASGFSSGSRRRERERQGLAVGAGAQGVRDADGLGEGDRHGLVGRGRAPLLHGRGQW